ncbi:MAG: DNA polymerase Y family protein [Alphaproteobacteria bacterium]|nr:MAG: DNA polymerase Y family protein [Alphaproteobacteria bacterium]
MQRIICIWLPFLESERLIRREPELADKPFVLITREAGRVFISAASRRAGKLGFPRGMSLVDARAAMPDIPYFDADRAGDLRCLRGLMRMMARFSPRVARAEEGSDLYLDVAGASHLFGGELPMLHRIEKQLESAGFTARLALAGSRTAAWGFAHYGKNRSLVPETGLRAASEGLPVAALRMSEGSTSLCQRLGLKKIGDLLRLPRGALSARIGLSDMTRLDRFMDRAPEARAFARHRERLIETEQFPDPLATGKGVEAALEILLERLCARLAPLQQGIRRARLDIERVDHAEKTFTIRTMHPGLDIPALMRLFTHHFEQLDVGFGIERMTLTAEAVAPLQSGQARLGDSPQKAVDAAVEQLVAELANMFGPAHILKFAPVESHIPERAFRMRPALHPGEAESWPVLRARRPLRLLKKPLPVLEGEPPGFPSRILWNGKSCAVTPLSGPERIEPDWWRDDPLWRSGARDYWWGTTSAGAVLWLYSVTEAGHCRWYLHGMGS